MTASGRSIVLLLLPLARYLAARSRASLLTGIAAWALLGGWYSAYALIAWPGAI